MNDDQSHMYGQNPSVSAGLVVLNYDLTNHNVRRATRADIMKFGGPTVIGYDSTKGKECLPGQWTLVNETNMEKREPEKVNKQYLRLC